ncbi:MAG TPA: NUMOD4 domain-containing protein [Fluviicola sp.]|nr:NUMOD4 domain-containing protein [Fluviicola sp.]
MDIIWKPIPGFTDYEISTIGTIRSLDRVKQYRSGRKMVFSGKEKLLRVHPSNGFLMTDLIDDRGKRRTVYPHKMVALVYVANDKPRKRKVVIHMDGDPRNNSVENLSWSSFSESIKRGFELGLRDNSTLWEKRRAKYGPKGGNKAMGRPDPLTEEQKQEIRRLHATEKLTLAVLAKRFNCSISHIHKTLKRAE